MGIFLFDNSQYSSIFNKFQELFKFFTDMELLFLNTILK